MSNSNYVVSMRSLKSIACDSDFNSVKVISVNDTVEVAYSFFKDDLEIYESFYCMYFNSNNKLIGFAKIGQGGVSGTVADAKIIFKHAIDMLACGIILVHNHPSGNLKPSEQDIKLTNRIAESAKLFDMRVLDHLILTKGGFTSFQSAGLIK